MKIIVDELPCSCSLCMFNEYDMLRARCVLSKFFTDGHGDRREEHCPLINFDDMIKHIKG